MLEQASSLQQCQELAGSQVGPMDLKSYEQGHRNLARADWCFRSRLRLAMITDAEALYAAEESVP